MINHLIYSVLLFLVVSVTSSARASSTYADSLERYASTTTNKKLQLKTYNTLAFYYNAIQSDKAYIYGVKTYELATTLKLPQEQCKALVWQAAYSTRKQQYVVAVKQFKQALVQANATKDDNLIGFVNSWTGYYYLQTHDYYAALIYFKDAYFFLSPENYETITYNYYLQGTCELALNNAPAALTSFRLAINNCEKLNNAPLLFLCNNGLANALVRVKHNELALPQIDKSIALAVSINEPVFIDDALNNKAIMYMLNRKYSKAVEVFNVINTHTLATKNYTLKTNCCNNLALAYYEIRNYPQALFYADTAIKYAQLIMDKTLVAQTLLSKANILKALNNLPKAFECVSAATLYATAAQNTELAYKAVSLSSRLMYNQGNYKGAFEMLTKANHLADSLHYEQRIEDAVKATAEIKFEQRLKNDSLKRLAQDNVKNKQQAAKDETVQSQLLRQRIIIAIAVLIAMLITAMAYNWRKNFSRVKKLNHLLEEQKEEIEIRREKLQLQNVKITAQRNAIEEKNKEITDSITYARRIQNALLTSENFISAQVKSHAIFYQPKDIVSGDFYWAENVSGKFILASADCTGHGVPGAFMSLLGISFLNEIIVDKRITRPNDVLDTLRDSIIKALSHDNNNETYRDGMDMSLCSFDFNAMILELSSANSDVYLFRAAGSKGLVVNGKNVLPEKYNSSGALYCVKSDKYPVGTHVDDLLPFTLNKIQLQANDVVFTGSDGYADQFGGPKLKKFKYNQLEELLIQVALIPDTNTQKELLATRFNDWMGTEEQVDDVLVMVIKV